MKRLPLLSLATAMALGFAAVGVRAQSLSELYASARAFDAGYLSAKAQFDANVAKAAQANATLYPTVGIGGTVSASQFDAYSGGGQVNRQFGTNNASLQVTQPLYRPGNLATYRQGEKQLVLAQALLDAANQDLIVRVSQAYFDVLAASDTLTFVRAQKTAVAEQLASAKRNFEVGTATITDTREAQARYDLVLAQEIAADNDVRVKKLALDTLVGKPNSSPKPLAVPVALPALGAGDVETWVQNATNHPSVQQALVNLDVAKLETRKAESGHLPTVDLIASYTTAFNRDGSTVSGASSRTNLGTVGVNFTMPLFAGFATQNRIKETLALEEKARTDLEGAQRTVAQATRTAYFGVLSGNGQVKALEAAEASSQSALDANKLGYQVGVRINIDVLNSQSQLYQTKRDLAKARYDVLVGGLKLRQANGSLTAEDIQAVNALLAR